MASNKKVKKSVNKKVVLQKKAKAQVKIKQVAPKVSARVRTKLLVKTKKAKPKAQIKTRKVMLKTKAKTAVQIKTKKVAPKAKIKTQVKAKKAKKAMSKSKAAANKRVEEIVPKKDTLLETILGSVGVQPYRLEKNEEYMNKKQRDHFRAILLQWKERLMEDADHAMHRLQEEASNHPDPIDRASKEEEFGLELHTRDRKRKFLKKIEETLVRFNNGSYGYCDDCGAEIGIHRLEVHPTAMQCIECRTVTETKEKQVGEAAVTKDYIQD